MKNTTLILSSLASVMMIATGPSLAKDRKANYVDRFEKADTNNDGKVSRHEMVSRATARFSAVDKDGNGEISVAEMADRIQRRRDERRAKRMLRRMDYNGDGKVTKNEIESRASKRFCPYGQQR